MNKLKRLGFAAIATLSLLGIAGASSASATTLELAGSAQNKAVSIEATLTAGSSLILKDESGTTTDTCTSSEIKATTGTFTGASPIGGPVSTLSFAKCTHTTTVLKSGRLLFTWDTAGTNGTVWSSEAEWTVQSTFFGSSSVCKSGVGTKIGTLLGVKSGHASILTNGKINCGILGSAALTASYTVTSPTGLGIVS